MLGHPAKKIYPLLLLCAIALVSCQLSTEILAEELEAPTPTTQWLMTPTPLILTSPENFTEVPLTSTASPLAPPPSATVLPSITPLPAGYAIVPDFRGMPLAEARTLAVETGFSFLFQDVLDPEVPSSTIVDQDPPAGMALPKNEIIFLYRSFQALQMYAGGKCQPLRITLPSGKLLYWVELDEGVRYSVSTDFQQGSTQISDYRMYLLAEFENAARSSIDVKPLAPGRYVISLGPYEVSKSELEREGSISAGCLWITPEDLDQD